MRFSERLKRTVYVAPINRAARPVTYGTPVAYKLNVLPTTADSDVKAYGVGYTRRLRVSCDKTYGDSIHELDLVYVRTTPPATADPFAATADYVVESRLESVDSIEFILVEREFANG